MHYCIASEGFNGTPYRYLELSDKYMRHIKNFFSFETFKAREEDLSAEFSGASYLLEFNDLCMLVLLC